MRIEVEDNIGVETKDTEDEGIKSIIQNTLTSTSRRHIFHEKINFKGTPFFIGIIFELIDNNTA